MARGGRAENRRKVKIIEKYDYDHLATYPPVTISILPATENRTGSWRDWRPVFERRLAPCAASCPVGYDIPKVTEAASQGGWEEALSLLLDENPMPEVLGRICPHPCEGSCNRAHFGEPVAIHLLERYLADLAPDADPPPVPEEIKTNGIAVAAVGSGPAGLTFAYQMARLGYGVKIYEAKKIPGGVPALSIPEYRLPGRIINNAVARVLRTGVQIECGVSVGRDIPIWKLLSDFAAVFIATGAHKEKMPAIIRGGAEQIYTGLRFLEDVKVGRIRELTGKAVVIGGGNTAVDAARCALRSGARPVIFYRRRREDMPAFHSEVRAAEAEGVEFVFQAEPVQIKAGSGGQKELVFVMTKPAETGADGRAVPVPVPGSEFSVRTDIVIMATGEEPDLSSLVGAVGAEPVAEGGLVMAGDKILIGGDAATKERIAANAVAAGKMAAILVDQKLRGAETNASFSARQGAGRTPSFRDYITFLTGKEPEQSGEMVRPEEININYFRKIARTKELEEEPAERVRDFREIVKGLNKNGALTEAERCFRCGLCDGCDNCYIFCPDLAIKREAASGRREFLYDYCKGCGICYNECPRAAISLIREEY